MYLFGVEFEEADGAGVIGDGVAVICSWSRMSAIGPRFDIVDSFLQGYFDLLAADCDACDMAAMMLREVARGAAESTADIEYGAILGDL